MGERDRAAPRMRARWSILVKLTVAFAAPTLALFSAFAIVATLVAARDLEAELGRRLTAIAASASTQLRGKYLIDLQPEDATATGEGHLFYDGARRKLEEFVTATSVARMIVFDRDFTTRI